MDYVPYVSGAVGLIIGIFISILKNKSAIQRAVSSEDEKYKKLLEAQELKIKSESKIENQEYAEKEKKKIENDLKDQKKEIKDSEIQLRKREEALEKRNNRLDQYEDQVKKRESIAEAELNKTNKINIDLKETLEKGKKELLKITKLREEDAKEILLKKVKDEMDTEIAGLIRENKEKIEEDAEKQAGKIISLAITRLASPVTAESTTSIVELPSDDVKGKIIGREGRNIRAFEKSTGVDVIVDDTPGVIVLSCFDKLRREVALRSMEVLLKDGRIHPTRIEEVVLQVEGVLEKELIEIGTKTIQDLKLGKMHSKLRYYLGRMKYRTSYGQCMLNHSIEVASLCANMASELKLDIKMARRAGLLHDIGKAADQEMEGTHPQIGAELGRKYDEHPWIVNAIASHHEDIEMISEYSFLTMAADAISSARPGARRESSEAYIERLEALEGIANGFNGVEQSFAIQAGREVRVMVDAHQINDDKSLIIAREIAEKIEKELQYPGHVKVTVMRELRVEEFAK